jgi:hypothetical protein
VVCYICNKKSSVLRVKGADALECAFAFPRSLLTLPAVMALFEKEFLMIFNQRNSFFVYFIFSVSFFLSCKSRTMNESDARSASVIHEFEFCGRPVSMKMSSDKSTLIYMRTDWQTAVRLSEMSSADRGSTRRLVEVTFRAGLPAPRTVDAWNSKKSLCIRAELVQERIFAKSFTIRDSALREREITACGEIFEDEGLFGVYVATERERLAVLLVGRNTKETRQVFTSLVGELACVRGRPFLAQESLALLTDSASIARAEPREFSLSYRSRDPEEIGKRNAQEFIDRISHHSTEDKIDLLVEDILRTEEQSEKHKWRIVEQQANGRSTEGGEDEWLKTYYDAEIIQCCDKLNELVEYKNRGFFQKIFRKGANPSTMYMDGKNDFSELRKNELYEGDVDLELDLL